VALADLAPHRRGTITARIETPLGPIIVYGTVIPYTNEPSHDDGRPARRWEVHLAEIARQSDEWQRLAAEYPDVPLIVAGDFNQARSGRPNSYGTVETRRALTEALDDAGLTCVSEGDFVADDTLERSHVEHICISRHLSTVGPLRVWDRRDTDGRYLSDHPTIAIDLTVATR
jgi:endonuclease/exonuclease/phosphatase family metal-dependent hydrolase